LFFIMCWNKYLNIYKYSVSKKEIDKVKKEIGSAIIALHKYGIIHRDLKPQNIFIRADETYVLGFFYFFFIFF
jgi:serine/threonine protein kinase